MASNFHQIPPRIDHFGELVPTFIYGTAWKKDHTEALVQLAVTSGFLGIDTANQRRHYHEAGVGRAVENILAKKILKREDLFLQSKFTYVSGQDHRLPYDPDASVETQVQQSFNSSLEHLNTAYLDSYILHGPAYTTGLSPSDWQVWQTMEKLKKSGLVKLLGVSNIGYDQLSQLIEKSEIKPAFVQNRCFAKSKWDTRIRELCRSNKIIYQGFSLLTANAMDLNHPEIFKVARRTGCSIPQVVFRFAMQVGMIPLTGTTDEIHMKQDQAVYGFELEDDDIKTVENISYIKGGDHGTKG